MEDVVLSILEAENVFTDVTMTSSREIVKSDGTEMSILSESGVQYIISKTIPYNEFLKRIMQGTNIPITTLHQAVSKYTNKNGMIKPEHFNENTVSIIIQKFQEWKNENLQGRFHYAKSSTPVGSTALSFEDGSPRKEIAQGRIGTKLAEGTPSEKYLYDAFAYDSPLEKKNIMADIEEVVVYGKIPRSSIAIPTITGGMYSPDFMYIVKKSTGEKELNIVVETKDVENKNNIRGTEKANLECAKVFFDILSKDGYTVHFRDQLNNRQMAQIINEIIGNG
jgi:type III restriction enzyme